MNVAPSFADRITGAPALYDLRAAARFREAAGDSIAGLAPAALALTDAAASSSPYLARLMLRQKEELQKLLAAPPEQALDDAIAAALGACDTERADEQLRLLREAKAKAALVTALADMGGVWPVMEATNALSRFADAAVEGALACAVASSPLADASGIVMLAMGKQGAFELNYSSDIDLVVLYDRDCMSVDDPHDAQKHAVAVTREVVRLLQTQTADGYVFRTDLRLRPDPGVSAAAVSVQSAETYYESFGQNWERMAFIKARPCAGDIALGERFLKTLRPFIWRKFLDFAAIEDVHAVKRQMNSAKGGAEIAFEGHDVKLGRGGIREIEFYAQTQQLILGGKDPNLRQRATLDALAALADAGAITQTACEALTESYLYLRHVEHRLQMVNDEQTHRLPVQEDDVARIAIFSGAANIETFRTKMLDTFKAVGARYDALFESNEDLESRLGPLVFTGVEPHSPTLETLEKLGFKRGPEICQAIMRWHRGSLRATRTERARALLTKLVPPLLEALAKAGEADEAFFAFEGFLERLPAGVQVFSLLLNNLDIFDALIRIMTISPYLGREFSKHINLVERLLDNRWSDPPPPLESYEIECAEAVTGAADYEAALNVARRWAGERKFQITAQLAVGVLPHESASRHYAAIADAAIRSLIAAAANELARQHGRIAGGDFVVIGLGRLGAQEMTATSDIDLMFVYAAPDIDNTTVQSDGKRPLGTVEYFTRLVRRAVTALSAATEEGSLYDVDMQLRPSGKAGPIAVSFSAFKRYYEEEAWTWEAMALVKARVIGPDGLLADRVEAEIGEIIARPRAFAELAADVADMRVRLDKAKPGAGVWDVKNQIGGLTDIAFICQHLTLAHASRLGRPPCAVAAALDWFAQKGELAQEDAAALAQANAIFEAVLQASRAATGGVFTPDKAGEALCARMASVCGEATIEGAEAALQRRQVETAKLFEKIVGERRSSGD